MVSSTQGGDRVREAVQRGKKRQQTEVSIVCGITESNFTKLRISRAYVDLLCLPEGAARVISLAWIGNCEIRMLEAPSTGDAGGPLFLIELFDHDDQSSADCRACCDIEEGAVVFETFASR
jgi:hypothetical protein